MTLKITGNEELDHTGSLADLLRNPRTDQETAFEIFETLDSEGDKTKRLEVCVQDVPPPLDVPIKVPAFARHHEFHSLATFGEYLKREAVPEKCVVLADVEARRMSAVLDEGSDTEQETVSFVASIHPLFKPWDGLLASPMPVRQFALFCQTHRSQIKEPDGRELALMFSQIKAAKTVTKRVGVGKNSINGVMVQMQIGSETKDHEVDLPDSIRVMVPLFLDTSPIEIEIDLLVYEAANGDLHVGATASEVDLAKVQAFEQMIVRLTSQTELIVGLGRVHLSPFEAMGRIRPANDRYGS